MNPELATRVDPFSLSGRHVVLTGGAGKLGRHFTQSLLDAGAKITIWDQASQPDWVHARASGGSSLAYRQLDIVDDSAAQEAAAEAERIFGPIHGLVVAAAIDAPPGSPSRSAPPFETTPVELWRRTIETNTLGAMVCVRAAGARMAAGQGGSIVLISSIYAHHSPDQRIYQFRRDAGEDFYKPAAYSVSKAALEGLTKYLATYWAAKKIRVNSMVLAGVADNQPREFLEGYLPKVPLGRMACPDDYSPGLQYLLSDASAYMTGTALILDGGYSAW